MDTDDTAATKDGGPPKARVFISYSRKDMAFADRLEAALKTRGIECLIDRSEIYAFEDWWQRIEALIARADTVVFVLSPDSVSSEVALREVAFAASLNKRFAPIVFRRVSDKAVPEALARLNFIFFDEEARFEASADKLTEALSTDIEWIRKHTELSENARRWAAAGRPGPRGLLLRSPLLEEAERWIATRPADAPSPTEDLQAFIADSRRAATRRRNVVTGSMGGGLIVALALAGLAYWQRGIAVENETQAKAERDRALVTQSLFLADLARQKRTAGDAGTAILLALEALPDAAAGLVRPYVPEAEFQLDAAWRTLHERATLAGHRAVVLRVAFSPDGQRIVTASADKTAQIWDAATGKPMGEPLVGHEEDGVTSAAFSPDGTRIVTSGDKTVRLWDAQTGRPIGAPLTGHEHPITSAAFSPDGKRIVTASWDDTAKLWDAETGRLANVLIGHTSVVYSAAFSPDNRRIVTASADKTAQVWDAETGRPIGEPLVGHEGDVTSAAFSPDGRRIVTSGDNTARLWDAATGKSIAEPFRSPTSSSRDGGYGDMNSAAFSPDGKRVVTASSDKTMRLWDAETGKQIGEPLLGHTHALANAAFSPDGLRIVTASFDKTARLWDTETANPIVVLFDGHEHTVFSAAFSPDGGRIVTASFDQTVRLWNAETGKQIGEPLKGHDKPVKSAAFSPDGKRIVTASADARLWDSETGKQIGQPLMGHTHNVESAEFSPDGRRIVTASADRTARLWDAGSGKPIGIPLTGHQSYVNSAAFSPDGKRIVTASDDKTARLWDAQTGKPIGAPLTGHRNTVNRAAFSPDGKRIVTVSRIDMARLWHGETGKQIGAPLRNGADIVFGYSAAFSPDGRRIVTASDQAARLWDAETGKPVGMPITDHQSYVNSAAFSPDGNRIVTATDQTARVWKLFADTQDFVAHAKAAAPRCLSDEQRQEFFLPAEPPAWCIELEKWPYHTQAWKDWLRFKRANANLPLPDTPDWQPWVDAQQQPAPNPQK